MTDARAMPWSEARPWIAALVSEVDDHPFLRMDKRCVDALDVALALGDRCAQAEERSGKDIEHLNGQIGLTMAAEQRAEQAEQLDQQRRREVVDVLVDECGVDLEDHERDDYAKEWRLDRVRWYLQAGHDVLVRCYEMRTEDKRRAEQAEAETARLREESAVMEQRIVHDTDHINRFIACVMNLEAQIAVLTQERDTLRAELLERDDMREGV